MTLHSENHHLNWLHEEVEDRNIYRFSTLHTQLFYSFCFFYEMRVKHSHQHAISFQSFVVQITLEHAFSNMYVLWALLFPLNDTRGKIVNYVNVTLDS